MKHLILLASALLTFATPALARDTHVSGYTRKDGTYVQPHTRSAPDRTVTDNYSYKGNANPYTGDTGTNRYPHDTTSPYYQGPDNQGRSGHR